jgi:hypothetical protein
MSQGSIKKFVNTKNKYSNLLSITTSKIDASSINNLNRQMTQIHNSYLL